MERRIGSDFGHWHPRITLRTSIPGEIQALAREEARSMACMIGVLLLEALTARSSA